MKLKPLNNRIVVRPNEAADKTPAGILIPDSAKEKPKTGIVLAVGPGRMADDGTRIEMQLKPKDKVLFPQYAGIRDDFDGERLIVMSEDEVLAIVE